MRYLLITLLLLSLPGTCVLAQNNDAFQYRELGPYRGGRVTTVAGTAHRPGTYYLGATGGGVWKTEDYGTRWRNVSDGFFSTPSIGDIRVADTDPNVVYVGTGSDGYRSNLIEGRGMYKSIDGGEHWTEVGLEKVGQIGAVRIHPTDHGTVFVAAIGKAFQSNPERGLYRTTNGGEDWEAVLQISNQTGISDVEFLPTNPRVLFAAAWKAERKPWTIVSGGTPAEGGIYKSVDGGDTWRKIETGLPDSLIGKIDLAVTPADSRIVYALVEAPGDAGGLYKSTDQGESFVHVSSYRGLRTRPFYYTNLKVDPQNPDVLYSMATGNYKSTDGGKTWNFLRTPHGDNHDMWIDPNNPDLYIQANDGGANVTLNGGKSWSTQFNQPTAEIYQVEVDNQYPYWLYGGQQDNYSTVAVPSMPPFGSQTAGIGYVLNAGGCETGPAVPHPTDPNIVFSNCKGRFTVYDKRTGTEQDYYVGNAYMYGHNPKDLEYRFQRVAPIHVSPHDPETVYHCSQYVHRTRDRGKTWEVISPDLTAFESDKQVISGSPITRDITGEEYYSTIYAIRESPVTAGVIWAGANDGPVHVTRDGGENWSDVTPAGLPAGGRVDAVEPSPHDPAKAYAAVLRYQLGDPKPYLYKTENYGKSWTPITTGLSADNPTRVIREDPLREGLLFAGTERGVYVSYDDGTNWRALQLNLPLVPITDMKIHQGDLVLSTMGRGFWVLDDIGRLRAGDPTALSGPQLFVAPEQVRFRHPSGARGSTMPRYPRPGVVMDYHLPEEAAGSARLVISNTAGDLSISFLPGAMRNDSSSRDMATGTVTEYVNYSLPASAGMNRFRWDMRAPGAWHENENRRYQGGPLLPPGDYVARLTVGEQTVEKTFRLRLDPRVEAAGITAAAVQQQFETQLAIRDLLSEARQLEADLVGTDNDGARQALATLRTPEGTYQLPGLISQIGYLYNSLGGADQVPGQETLGRLEELRAVLGGVSGR
ncbi:MAG: hypothetical protein AAFZ52_10570 [Bacteroidota bacterium]